MIFLSPCRFQSTFPRGERHLCWLVAVKHIHFNPRSLVGNDSQYQPVLRSLQDFNPRSLVGNDGESSLETQIYIISIHVPSWGTTLSAVARFKRHTISIHVPSWGTTLDAMECILYVLFQSTFPRGERLIAYRSSMVRWIFQSTFPRGERLRRPGSLLLSDYFNPRSLVGNDGKFSQIFFVFLCNKYNFSTFYYPFSLFFSVIHVTFLIFVVRILPAFYVYF